MIEALITHYWTYDWIMNIDLEHINKVRNIDYIDLILYGNINILS